MIIKASFCATLFRANEISKQNTDIMWHIWILYDKIVSNLVNLGCDDDDDWCFTATSVHMVD